MMKQYAIFHKPNMTPISFFCTEAAGMERLEFITDCNVFGLFEVDVTIIGNIDAMYDASQHTMATVCTINNCVLSVHPTRKTAFQHTQAICAGLISVCAIEYTHGKEIKRPKKEKDNVLNDFS